MDIWGKHDMVDTTEMGLLVALAETTRGWQMVDVLVGVQDLEDDPARLGPVCTGQGGRGDPHDMDGVGDHPKYACRALSPSSACSRTARPSPPGRVVAPAANFFRYVGV